MVRRKKEKTLSLAIAIFILCLSLCDFNYMEVGASQHPTLSARLLYSFFHTNIFHALINIWCFLSVVFVYEPSWRRLLLTYIIAVAVPPLALSTTPTIGLSVVCYALLGATTFEVQRKLYYTMWIATFVALGFLFPYVNATIHLYGYLAGLIVGLLNAPLCKR